MPSKAPRPATALKVEVGQAATIVWSETTAGVFYRVTDNATACTCPGFTYRGACKHLGLARDAEAAFDSYFQGNAGTCACCGRAVAWRDALLCCAVCVSSGRRPSA